MSSKYKYIYDKLHELIQNLDMKRKVFSLSKKNTDVYSCFICDSETTCRLLYWVTVLHP